MRDRLQQRLEELRSEFEAGQKMLAELDAKQAHLKTSLLRISGAIQVLEELLGSGPQDNHAHASAAAPELPTAGVGMEPVTRG